MVPSKGGVQIEIIPQGDINNPHHVSQSMIFPLLHLRFAPLYVSLGLSVGLFASECHQLLLKYDTTTSMA